MTPCAVAVAVFIIEGQADMSLREPHFKPKTNHVQLVLQRLHQQAPTPAGRGADFRALCTMVSIPHDLRSALLRTLVDKGYVTVEAGETIRITKAGTNLAMTPLA
jgi:predicted methyltransferase